MGTKRQYAASFYLKKTGKEAHKNNQPRRKIVFGESSKHEEKKQKTLREPKMWKQFVVQ